MGVASLTVRMTSLVKPLTAALVARDTLPPGDDAARFRSVYDECFPMVWRALRRLGVSEAAVADAAQDVFLRVHCNLASFEARSSVRSWVFGIAINVAREHRRRARSWAKVEPRVSELPPPVAATPDEAVACNQALRLLDSILDELDDDRRAVLVLAEWEEMTASEIAAALNVNVNTVYTRLRAARADFDAALARRERRAR